MPTWKELRKYLRRNGWVKYRNSDHDYYRLQRPDGSMIYTRCSRGNKEIPSKVWKDILKHELRITQEEFNANK